MLFPLAFNDQYLQILGDFGVAGEFDRVAGAALGHGAQRCRVTEKFGERNIGVDYLHAAPLAHFLNGCALGVEVADHLAHEVLRGDDLGLHDRLKDDDAGMLGGILHGHRAGDLKGHFRRVNIMVGAVIDRHFGVDDRVAGQNAVLAALRPRLSRSA